MIVIFPASRKHSSVYSGELDRVMVGVNFYAIPGNQFGESKQTLLTEGQKSLKFSERRKELAEKKEKKKKKEEEEKHGLNATRPSDTEINNLLQHYQNGRYRDVSEELAVSLSERFPTHHILGKCLASCSGN